MSAALLVRAYSADVSLWSNSASTCLLFVDGCDHVVVCSAPRNIDACDLEEEALVEVGSRGFSVSRLSVSWFTDLLVPGSESLPCRPCGLSVLSGDADFLAGREASSVAELICGEVSRESPRDLCIDSDGDKDLLV